MARDDARADEVSQYPDTYQPNPGRAARFYPHHEPGNWCDLEGASALRAKIAERWKGYAIDFKLIPAGFTTQMRTSRFDLRSNMVNGWPRGMFKSAR